MSAARQRVLRACGCTGAGKSPSAVQRQTVRALIDKRRATSRTVSKSGVVARAVIMSNLRKKCVLSAGDGPGSRPRTTTELTAPPEAAGDPESVELLRAWIIRATLQCSIQTDAFADPGAWGAVLADVVRHVASARQQQEGIAAAETIQRILAVLDEEMRSPGGGAPE
jgi:hypothetical protein